MTVSRRTIVGGLAAASTATFIPRRWLAADYPARPIQLVVPFAAGGNADIVGRIAGDLIGRGLNGTVVVENRGGAGGGIGAEYVAKANPDGYTLLVGSNGPLTVNPFIHAKLGYDPLTDFVPVGLANLAPHAIVLNDSVGAKSVAELVEMSKKQQITLGTSGVG